MSKNKNGKTDSQILWIKHKNLTSGQVGWQVNKPIYIRVFQVENEHKNNLDHLSFLIIQ